MNRSAIIELRAADGYENAVSDFLQAHASRSRTLEKGCIDFQIGRDPDASNAFFLIMLYETAEAQAAHRETEHFKRFLEECVPMLEDAPDGTKFFTRRLLDRIA
jgi:quinol monooxygenase YgiN